MNDASEARIGASKTKFFAVQHPIQKPVTHRKSFGVEIAIAACGCIGKLASYPFNTNQSSNMKKTTKKATETKAPAKKTVVADVSVKKASSPVSKKKTVVNTEPPATIIFAKIDIGFGNHLYIRGEAPGMSWDHGIAMDCVGAGLWTISIKNTVAPVVFKLLVNDLSWSTGPDFVAQPGQSLTVDPSF